MARTENTLRMTMITQQLEEEFWSLYSADVRALVRDAMAVAQDENASVETLREHAALVGNVVLQILDDKWPVAGGWAIIHDKDTQHVWDADLEEIVERPKVPHIHIFVRFETKGGTPTAISDLVRFPPAHIEKPKSGRHSYDNQLSYLIHAKDASKYAYSPEQVATLTGRDYMEIAAESSALWKKGRAVKTANTAVSADDVEDLFERCLKGEVRREQILLDDNLMGTYARRTSYIDSALNTYAERRALLAAKALKSKEFETNVIYVTGKPGSGKSYFGRDLAAYIAATHSGDGPAWEVYEAGKNNPMDEYAGEEVLLLDDLRSASMSVGDWLGLLNPDAPGKQSARYRNKSNVAPRAIIITAWRDPVSFFFFLKGNGGQSESVDQFIRRLCAIVEVVEFPDGAKWNTQEWSRGYVFDVVQKRDEYVRNLKVDHYNSVPVKLTYGSTQKFVTLDPFVMFDVLAGRMPLDVRKVVETGDMPPQVVDITALASYDTPWPLAAAAIEGRELEASEVIMDAEIIEDVTPIAPADDHAAPLSIPVVNPAAPFAQN